MFATDVALAAGLPQPNVLPLDVTVTLPESPAAKGCDELEIVICVWLVAGGLKSLAVVDVSAMSSKSNGSRTITGTRTDLNFVLTCVSVTDSEITTSALPAASAVIVVEPGTATTS